MLTATVHSAHTDLKLANLLDLAHGGKSESLFSKNTKVYSITGSYSNIV